MLLLRFLAVIGTATGKGITRPAGRLAPSVGRSRSLDSRRSDLVAGGVLGAGAGVLFFLFFFYTPMLPTPLAAGKGRIFYRIHLASPLFSIQIRRGEWR